MLYYNIRGVYNMEGSTRRDKRQKVLDNLVYGNISDVVRLVCAMRSDSMDGVEVERLDLRPIKTLKVTPQGGVEVELYDRLAVRAALREEQGAGNARPLYEALQASIRAIAEARAYGDDEES